MTYKDKASYAWQGCIRDEEFSYTHICVFMCVTHICVLMCVTHNIRVQGGEDAQDALRCTYVVGLFPQKNHYVQGSFAENQSSNVITLRLIRGQGGEDAEDAVVVGFSLQQKQCIH